MKILNFFLAVLVIFMLSKIIGNMYDKAFAPLPKFENVTVPVNSFVESKMGFNTTEPVSKFELKSDKAVTLNWTEKNMKNLKLGCFPFTNWWFKFERDYHPNVGFYIYGRHLSQKERSECIRGIRFGTVSEAQGISDDAIYNVFQAKTDGCHILTDDRQWKCPATWKEYQRQAEERKKECRENPDPFWPCNPDAKIINPCEK